MGTIADKLNKLQNTKKAIKQAIIDKGVEVTDNDTFESYADKISSIQSGGGNEGNHWILPNGTAFGYSTWETLPEEINNADISQLTTMEGMFYQCTNLTSLDLSGFDTSNVTNMRYMFSQCWYLNSITFGDKFNTSNVNDMNSMFDSCESITSLDLNSFNTSNVEDMGYMFQYCYSLPYLDISNFDTSKVSTYTYIFNNCSSLKKIDGYISLKSITNNITQYTICGSSTNTSINKITFKDLGSSNSVTLIQLNYISKWGVNSDEVPDARQSLIDSLITYSFDRKSAGYPSCRIQLNASFTKPLLTSDEIAAITAKGYTIV